MDDEIMMEEVESSTTENENGNSENEEVVEETVETVETEETAEEEKPNPIDNSKAFSERLKKARAKDTKRINELEESLKGLNSLKRALGNYGYEGSLDEIADAITASYKQITPEEARAKRQAEEEAISDIVNHHPSVIAAQELIEENKMARVQAMLNEDLRVIRQLDPSIKEISDLAKHPQAGIINALVKNGATYGEAFKQIHELTHGKTTKKQDTKEHLKGMGGGDGNGTGTLYEIPKEMLGMYQDNFPNDSYAQLRERYNRVLKRQKGE